MAFEDTLQCAMVLDSQDSLAKYRDEFLYPGAHSSTIYFCGNSLGLQPKRTRQYLQSELDDWGNLAVDGHFQGANPWFEYHKFLKKGLVELVGAKEAIEVTPMGSLTTNLHLLMVSFFRPSQEKFKIIVEAGAFPSDQYTIETQCRFHGLDPNEAIIELAPSSGNYTLNTSKITECITKYQGQVALVLLSGVQYFTGQLFDIKTITEAGHSAGAIVGWDLAHAIGNVPLFLHDHQVDFAAWCTYKYLNSGPGATAGIFVHNRHAGNSKLPRFGGWWGYPEEERFQMKKGFVPASGADGWQLSNANVLSLAAQRASLDIFLEAGITNLREKSLLLTGYLEFILKGIAAKSDSFQVITPKEANSRGCQLSLVFNEHGKSIFDGLTENGVIVDWREPNVIRVAPTPLYNTFQEVFRFGQILKSLIL